MCNFRVIDEIVAHLTEIESLTELCGGQDTLSALRTASNADSKKSAYRQMFTKLMTADTDAVTSALEQAQALVKSKPKTSAADDLFMRLNAHYPGDVGCFAAYLLNYVRITAGQAFFMAANEPHAYLLGQCVEIMATSDNVVRAGLTPKFKDVSTLVEMLTYQDKAPEIMDGVRESKYSIVYQPPAEEFQLTRISLPAGESTALPPHKGPGMLMAIGGCGWVGLAGGEVNEAQPLNTRLPISQGSLFYIQEGHSTVLKAEHSAVQGEASPDLFVFRASVNQALG